MPAFCVRREHIEKLKNVFKKLEGQNKLETISRLSSEKRVEMFSHIMDKDEAVLLNKSFEKSWASEDAKAIVNFVRDNLDIITREKRITQAQKRSISSYIDSKINPSKKKTEIVTIDDLLKMPEKEIDDILKKTFGDEKYLKIKEDLGLAQKVEVGQTVDKLGVSNLKKEINEKISEARGAERDMRDQLKQAVKSEERVLMKEITEKMKEIKDLERKAYLASPEYAKIKSDTTQRSVIERYLKNEKKQLVRSSVPIKEILKMKQDEQLSFLKTLMSEEDAIKAQAKINELSAGGIEKEINERLARVETTGLKNFSNFLERKIDQISAIKAGTEFSPDEVDEVVKIYQNIGEKKSQMTENPTKENIMAYGEARMNYMEWAEEAQLGGANTLKDKILSLVGMQRAVQLGVDFGTTLVQGAGILTRKEAWKAIYQGFRNVASKAEYRDMQKLIIGDPLYDIAKKSGLRINFFESKLGKKEESVMWNKLQESGALKGLKVGINEGLGFFERYTNSLSKARFEIFKDMVATSKSRGIDVSPTTEAGKKELKDIVNAINDITGSSGLGIFEKNVPEANVVFLSARLMVSKFKNLVGTPILTAEHYAMKVAGKSTRYSDTVIQERMRSFAGMVALSASALSLAKMSGAEVDTNPTSSNFGKIKIGNQWKDATFGYAPYIKLIAKQVSGKTTTYGTGITKSLTELTPEEEAAGEVRARGAGGSEIGRGEIALKFLRSKLSAVASVFVDVYTGKTYMGDETTVSGEFVDKMRPLGAKDLWDTWTRNDDISILAKIPLSVISFVGVGGYTEDQKDWFEDDGKELKQFREKIGDEKFREANKEFNENMKNGLEKVRNDERYKNMTPADQQKVTSKLNAMEKQKIFKKNKFIYKEDVTKKDTKIEDVLK